MSTPIVLSPSLIQSKTKQQNITEIRHLNIWNCNLGDVSLLEACTQLEVLSLSVNKITSLAPFQRLTRLKELYLRNNEIASLSELRYLRGLTSLHVLWLCGNPCSLDRNYRLKVVAMLPNIDRLDSQEVTPEEREQARRFMENDLLARESIVSHKSLKEKSTKAEPSSIALEEDDASSHSTSPRATDVSVSLEVADPRGTGRRSSVQQDDHKSETSIDGQSKRSKWNTQQSSEANPLHVAKQQVKEDHTYVYDANNDHSYQQMQSTLREMREKISQQEDQIHKLQKDSKVSQQDRRQPVQTDMHESSRKTNRTQESILVAMLTLLKELDYSQLLTLERELESQKKVKEATL